MNRALHGLFLLVRAYAARCLACWAYSFQTFSALEILGAAKMNQIEVNIRDHQHGVAGVVLIDQTAIDAAAVGQGELNTTTASGGTLVDTLASAAITLTGGTYAWWTAAGAATSRAMFHIAHSDTAAGVIGVFNSDTVGRNFNRDERYIQASPPYTHGPTFVFLMIDSLGKIINIEVGFDPPWAYHGPTDIRPQRRSGDRAFRNVEVYDGKTMAEILAGKNDALIRAILAGEVPKQVIEREITLEYKDSDKNTVPHPWIFNLPGYFLGMTVVMLEPGTKLMQDIEGIAAQSHAREVRDLIRRGYLNISNTPIILPSQPASVSVLSASWKLTV